MANGEEACLAADGQPFDLVILDVVMPGRSCPDTMAHIRERRPEAKVLLSSGYTADTNVAELLRDPRLKFLRKPYDPQELLLAVRRSLDGSV